MVDFSLNVYIYRSQFSLKHSEIQSDLKFIVLVVSQVFWIIKYCGLNIHVLIFWLLDCGLTFEGQGFN